MFVFLSDYVNSCDFYIFVNVNLEDITMKTYKLRSLLLALMGWGMVTAVFAGTGNVTVEQDFRNRMDSLSVYIPIFNQPLSNEEREALMFLYAYMPLPDLTDYTGKFYKENVDYSLKARREMPWGAIVPEREFRHFVLPVRVNNENLDESRKVFYEELKDRVKGLSMYDAVLEVNHWCHEKVTYKPSDSRTSSPLASVRTAYGRCGEESTFTVAALRAVGIPARQVYTPRWAHTDDNHAWVEAWVDGKWYFLGACEPEPVLNMAWFNAPASRGMLMHTKVFGRYDGPEDVMSVNPCYTEINVTANYASVSPVQITVMDKDGNPVPHIPVHFKLYNYAEFYSAAIRTTDAGGKVSFSAGLGDCLVWAAKDGYFGFVKCSMGKDNRLILRLEHQKGYSGTLELDVVPPAGGDNTPVVTEEQVMRNKERFAYEDSVRNAYVATFPTKEEIRIWADSLGLEAEKAVALVIASRGNHEAIMKFLEEAEGRQDDALSLLQVLAEKDLRDTPVNVLKDHLYNTLPADRKDEFYYRYVMNPRVSNEMLTPYKAFFQEVLERDLERIQADPEQWITFCKENIRLDTDWNPQNLCMNPDGVWKLRRTDAHSRDIFFVAGARSMGIAARIDEVTGKVQYYAGGVWQDVDLDAEKARVSVPRGKLKLTYRQVGRLEDPKYYTHFTVSKIEDGMPVLQNYPESGTWKNLFKEGADMDAGDYLLVTGTRMASGKVLSTLSFLQVEAGNTVSAALAMREDKNDVQVIGSFNSEDLYYDIQAEKQKSVLSTTGRGYFIIGLLTPNTEPTNHALNDIAACKEDFEEWGRSIILLFAGEDDYRRFRADDFKGMPSTVCYGIDPGGKIAGEICEAMNLKDRTSRPVFIIADTFNRVVFVSQGYTIGLGEQLMNVISKLQ